MAERSVPDSTSIRLVVWLNTYVRSTVSTLSNTTTTTNPMTSTFSVVRPR